MRAPPCCSPRVRCTAGAKEGTAPPQSSHATLAGPRCGPTPKAPFVYRRSAVTGHGLWLQRLHSPPTVRATPVHLPPHCWCFPTRAAPGDRAGPQSNWVLAARQARCSRPPHGAALGGARQRTVQAGAPGMLPCRPMGLGQAGCAHACSSIALHAVLVRAARHPPSTLRPNSHRRRRLHPMAPAYGSWGHARALANRPPPWCYAQPGPAGCQCGQRPGAQATGPALRYGHA